MENKLKNLDPYCRKKNCPVCGTPCTVEASPSVSVEEIIKGLCKISSNTDEGYRQREIDRLIPIAQSLIDGGKK